MDPRNFLRLFQIFANRAGLEGNVHTLRHSAASVMLTNGIPMISVRDILEHSSIETTVDLYGHLTETEKAKATELLGTAF